jgi:hypothetical protein
MRSALALLSLFVVVGNAAPARAQIQVTPPTLTFPFQATGTTSDPGSFTVSNVGNQAIQVTRVTLSGSNPNQFSFEDPGSFGLLPGDTLAVNVRYSPVSAGAHSAILVFLPSGFPSVSARISGTAAAATIQVAMSTSSLDFGNQPVGSTSDPMTVGIRVPPTGIPVTISDITSQSPDFTVDTSLTKLSLAAGQTTSFAVRFVPSNMGTRSAQIDIHVTGLQAPAATIMARGNGTPGAGDGGAGDLGYVPYTDDGGAINFPHGGSSKGGCALARRGAPPDGALATLAFAAMLLAARRRGRAVNPRS